MQTCFIGSILRIILGLSFAYDWIFDLILLIHIFVVDYSNCIAHRKQLLFKNIPTNFQQKFTNVITNSYRIFDLIT